ncbi:MAG TPA: helix-turn-helix transcriptional regulator [Pyrinomonadaceae bacterium]|jgi:transcriptional regulator with XRE-family HTH domain|nr:helix-turn-helix transcriptional regulator [Pyrinomonadaceae bacterium]
MGRGARLKPERLSEKLIQIRTQLGLSQNELIKQLDVDLTQNRISEYETGTGEPPLPILLKYARMIGISTDVLIDDKLDLPDKLGKKLNRGRKPGAS